MISGIALLTLVLLSTNLSASAQAPDTVAPDAAASDLGKFVASLARPAPSSTAYAEVRFVHLLKKPLLMRGELDYGGADQLGKRIKQPYRETTTIAGSNVDVQREGRALRHFSLDRAPELQALLVGFSALLGGDAATLEKFYTVSLVDKATNWTLTLTPRAPALAKHLREIMVDGSANEPHCFSLHEADGDASVMLLGALATTKLSESPTLPVLDEICHRVVP